MKTKIISLLLGILLIANIFLASAVTIKDVKSYPSEVAPGEVFEISVKIENIHSYDVENINVKLDLKDAPFAPYQSSPEKFLDELKSDDKEDFKFKLIALPDAASGIYKIPIQIVYEDNEYDEQTKNGLISVIVNSEPELKVSFDEGVLIKGRENVFSIKIINSGLADVKFVYIKANDVAGLNFVSEKEQYIGDIDSDDFDSVEYKVHINADASGTLSVPIILKFKDATNKEFTETKNVNLKIYSLKEARELGLVKKPTYTVYIIIGVLAVFYIGYRIRKKRKLKRLREGK